MTVSGALLSGVLMLVAIGVRIATAHILHALKREGTRLEQLRRERQARLKALQAQRVSLEGTQAMLERRKVETLERLAQLREELQALAEKEPPDQEEAEREPASLAPEAGEAEHPLAPDTGVEDAESASPLPTPEDGDAEWSCAAEDDSEAERGDHPETKDRTNLERDDPTDPATSEGSEGSRE